MKCEAINNRTTKQCWESKGNCRNSIGIPRNSNQNEESYEKCNSEIPKETFGIPRKCEAIDNRSTKQSWESKGNCRNSIGIPTNSNHTEESYENRSVQKSLKCFWRQRILVVALVSIKLMKKLTLSATAGADISENQPFKIKRFFGIGVLQYCALRQIWRM